MSGSRFTSRALRPLLVAGLLALSALALTLARDAALAQSGNGYDLTWNTVDGGGRTVSGGGGYALGGTMGQPDAGALTGGRYTLVGGFWGTMMSGFRVYLPLTLRSY
jgi:hypothetical protein